MRSIARVLGRSPSSISRELRRNGFRSAEARGPIGRPTIAGGYDATRAARRAQRLRHKARTIRKLDPTGSLWPIVKQHLVCGWSPQQIAGTLRCVSHETIYTAIYAMPRGHLRRELTSLLRQRHRARRSRRQGKDRRGQLLNTESIHIRPPEADERLLPGHWEGDLILGARNQSAVGTLVDRHSLFLMLAHLHGRTAEAALEGFSIAFGAIPPEQRKTLTYDQGKEMAKHQQLAERTGLKIYFADPHSPWQRGICENTNGLLRQYLPKGTDLSAFSQRELDQIAWMMNTRPRKSLGYRTPAEIFFESCYAARQDNH
jgi:IS30 family transposase